MQRPGLWVANGKPSDPDLMLSWRPGALTCLYPYLSYNRVGEYKKKYSEATIIVRIDPPWWQSRSTDGTYITSDPEAYGDFVAGLWPELRPLDPYVYFISEANLWQATSNATLAHQPDFETPQFYERYANWVYRVAARIKVRVPQMKLVCPPFASGHSEDGDPDENGVPQQGWAGYDYLIPAIQQFFNNIVCVHTYWGAGNGGQDGLRHPQVSRRFAFRYRGVLSLLKRQGIDAQVIIDEAGNFASYDADFTDQIIYHAQQCLSDARVLAVTYFLWEDPTHHPANEPNSWQRILDLKQHLARLTALPDVVATAGGPTLRLLMPDGSVQVMQMEEYLRGVVPAEVPPSWPVEVLRAQAVAARSYAAYAVEHPRHLDRGADLCTGTHCQVCRLDWVGKYPATDQAVHDTEGVLIYYESKVIDAFYSANCGGYTLPNEEGFRNPATGYTPAPVPYLRGVSCPNPGPKNGHGVGMCQWGAHDMAERGAPYQEILTHYYTGVKVVGPGGALPTHLKSGVIRGVVRDQTGVLRAGVHIALSGVLAASGAPVYTVFATDQAGAFHFEGLGPGDYSISVVGTDIKRNGLHLEEGGEIVAELTVPVEVALAWSMDVQQQTGLPLLIGSLPRTGIILTVEDPTGDRMTVVSGSKPEFGPGGFEIWLRCSGPHKVRFLDQQFQIYAAGGTVRVTFWEGAAGVGNAMITGHVRDNNGVPRPGRKVLLSGPVSAEQLTDTNGAYRFNELPPGEFTVQVEGTSVRQSATVSYGVETLTVDLTIPTVPVGRWRMTLKPMVGLRLLIGILPRSGIEVTVEGEGGSQVKVVSGSKPEYGPGAFEVPIWNQGAFMVCFLDQAFTIVFRDELIIATFTEETGPLALLPEARLLSDWMALSQAQNWLDYFGASQDYRGFFTLEKWAGISTHPEPTPGWTMTVERRSGLPLLVGRLPRAGIRVAVADPGGNRVSLVSGSKPEYGSGAFEVPVWAPLARYVIYFLDQVFPVEMRGDFVVVTFTEATEEQARLVSAWMPEDDARAWRDLLEGQDRTKGLVMLEHKPQ
jgi:hypothetical protein